MRRRSSAVDLGCSSIARNNDLGLDRPKTAREVSRAFWHFPSKKVAADHDRYLEMKIYHIPGKIAKTIAKRRFIRLHAPQLEGADHKKPGDSTFVGSRFFGMAGKQAMHASTIAALRTVQDRD
jgi:hypothetical protein